MSLCSRNVIKFAGSKLGPRSIATKPRKGCIKVIHDKDKNRKCDPRLEPKPPRKLALGEKFGKWFRKHVTGGAEPVKPPPYDPRPVCSDCYKLDVKLPPFPKIDDCFYEGIMEHSENQPPDEGEQVFLLQQYVVNKERAAMTPDENELLMLKYIEAESHVRDFQDPIKEFSSVGERLVELTDKRLHPYYKTYQRITPMECKVRSQYFRQRETRTPIRIRYNMKQLQKKNFYVDFKRMDPPCCEAYCTKVLNLKVSEKALLDMEKRAKIKEILEVARSIVKENDEKSEIVFKTVDRSYESTGVC